MENKIFSILKEENGDKFEYVYQRYNGRCICRIYQDLKKDASFSKYIRTFIIDNEEFEKLLSCPQPEKALLKRLERVG